jgi:hypothetical protein
MPTAKVTLDQTTTPWTVSIDLRPVKMPKNAAPQKIHWRLRGNAAAGQFLPLGGAKPGFSWGAAMPPNDVFTDLSLSAKKKSVSMTDHHPDAQSNGQWVYALNVKVGGVVYTTGATPMIKNN